jgi:ribonuclease G
VETPLPEAPADSPALPVQETFDARTGAAEAEYVAEHEDSSPTPEKEDSHTTHELSADEANALAEQVAEAQEEEAEAARQDDNAGFEAPGAQDLDIAALGEEAAETEDFTEPSATPDASGEMESAEAAVELGESQVEHTGEGASPAAPAEGSQPWKASVRSDFRARMQHPRRGRGRREERGRRPHQGHQGGPHRAAPRRPQLISEMLKAGEEIIVQIAKEPLGKKGARITSHIALPGRYLVFMPTLDHTGVSRKIASAEDRARLRHLVTEAKKGAGGGFIVRTAAAHASDEEIRTDVEFLMHTWNEIKARSEQRRAPALLHRDLNLVERILRDYLSQDYAAIWVDSEEEFTKVVDFVSRFQPQLVNRVKLYSKETPVFEEFGIQQEIDKGLRPKVWLKSGGYIVINHTEALVAIDVNTGKFVGRGSNRLEDTIVRTNVEASKEIVRQMRLRDLGGIIVIDYIDMEERRNREKVMAALEEALRADRAPSKVLRFNEFGLVAITRKRTKQALERTLCQPCPYCTGSGMVKSVPTLCYEIQVEARKMAPEIDAGSLTLRVHPEIAKALKTRESSLIEELEGWIRKSIIIQADPTLHWEQYDIY